MIADQGPDALARAAAAAATVVAATASPDGSGLLLGALGLLTLAVASGSLLYLLTHVRGGETA